MAGTRSFALAALLAAALGAAPVAWSATAAAPTVSATLTSCQPAPDQASRSATFSAQMSATASTRTMGERFELQQSTPAQPGFRDVPAAPGGFGAWQTSAPGVTILQDTQTVSNLIAPASFRVIVHYRWLDAHRRLLRTATRVTPACRMPDERPNLVLGSILVLGTSHYAVTVRNGGLGPAGPFSVALTVGGTALAPLNVATLAPRTATTLLFTGPPCTPGATVSAVADPARAVNETTRADNSKAVTC